MNQLLKNVHLLKFKNKTTAKGVSYNSTSSKESKILDKNTLRLLERLSLVNFENEDHISTVEDTIKFADLSHINTDNIKPLVTVLEESNLRLRDDIVNERNNKNEIMKNASLQFEDYFVAPLGNIPLSENSK